MNRFSYIFGGGGSIRQKLKAPVFGELILLPDCHMFDAKLKENGKQCSIPKRIP